jgi:hypothetical protein
METRIRKPLPTFSFQAKKPQHHGGELKRYAFGQPRFIHQHSSNCEPKPHKIAKSDRLTAGGLFGFDPNPSVDTKKIYVSPGGLQVAIQVDPCGL